MSKVDTIVSKAKTDATFYTKLAKDFNGTIAPYRLTREEISTLKTKLKAINPPSGTTGLIPG
jgi:hypothetical protein